MPATRLERNKMIADMRKQQILDAALEIYSKKGVASTTATEIAKAAGVSHGTVFNYFPRKDDILLSLVERYISLQAIDATIGSTKSRDSHDQLLFVVQNRLNTVFDDNKELNLIMGEIQRNPELLSSFHEGFIKPVIQLGQQYFNSGIAQGELRDINSKITVRMLMALLIGFTIIYKIEGDKGFLTTVNRKKFARQVTDIILRGISAKTNGEKKQAVKGDE